MRVKFTNEKIEDHSVEVPTNHKGRGDILRAAVKASIWTMKGSTGLILEHDSSFITQAELTKMCSDLNPVESKFWVTVFEDPNEYM